MNKSKCSTYNAGLPNPSDHLRIKDRLGHYLGEVNDGVLRIYCKRCKEYFEVPINQLGNKKT